MSLLAERGSHSKPLVITKQFHNLDVFAQAIKPLNITSNQLTPGCFLGSVNFADFGSLKFTHVNQNQALRVRGLKSPHDLIFAIALQANQTQVLSHGCLLKKQDIFGFDPDREVDIITGKESHIVFASVNLLAFESLAAQMGYDLGEKLLPHNSIRFHPATLGHLRAYFQEIVQILIDQPWLLMQPQMRCLLVEDFLPLLINTVGKQARPRRRRPKPFRRYYLVKQAEEMAKSYSDRPLTLQQLCDKLATSSSALCYGFQEIFGLSPMAYIKIQRLNGVRRALRNADPMATSVMQVAHKWGFWSAGHFAQDYKQMFGELPSQTLRSRPTYNY